MAIPTSIWTRVYLARVPVTLRLLLECIIKPEAVDAWLLNRESFAERHTTPLQVLVEAADSGEPTRFAADFRAIALPFYNALGYASAPDLLPIEALAKVVWVELRKSQPPRKHLAKLNAQVRAYRRANRTRMVPVPGLTPVGQFHYPFKGIGLPVKSRRELVPS